jgi:NAD(P)-dependent dehydrogenase (short-subunit alcohol dehydrogenase family)
MAHEGYQVIVNSRNAAECERVSADLGGCAVGVAADVCTEAGVKTLFAEVDRQVGHVDVLVNNAGCGLVRDALETSFDNWRTVIDADLTSVFLCSREAGRAMLRGEGGSIVNVSSIMAAGGLPGRVAYASAKGGVEAMTRVLAAEWAPRIRVNSIVSGYVKTALIAEMIDAGQVSEEEIVRHTPAGRMGRPTDVANAAAFLASPESEFITGTTLAVDGGWLISRGG